jgi:hypothetical protein
MSVCFCAAVSEVLLTISTQQSQHCTEQLDSNNHIGLTLASLDLPIQKYISNHLSTKKQLPLIPDELSDLPPTHRQQTIQNKT